jgi:DNA-binding transcriptional LysR family regulator
MSIEAVRSMVANGQGITILSDMVYRPWSLEGKRIATVMPGAPVPTMDIGLAWRRGATFTPQMDLIHAYFRQAFNSPYAS